MGVFAALLIFLGMFNVHVTTAFILDGVSDSRQPCTLCGPPIDVTLTASNTLRNNHFNFTVELRNTPQRELIHLLQEAAEQDGRFNFTVSYRRKLGFFVEAINGEKGDYAADRSWWHIYSVQPVGGAHCEGVSAYIPDHKESVVFLLTNQTLELPECTDVEI
ncbi:uncharacterized protein LOC143279525 [Babylonia areolata]|uniref:uncharacterized protein LOC143279525 n=1 Tax=Babylonia areolata TaxID=304850 RepID=UPI003FD3D54C